MFHPNASRRRRTGALSAMAAAAAIVGATSANALPSPLPAEPAAPLRACADPDNLPFSSAAPGPKGLYVELAERLGEALGRPVETVWYPTNYAKRAVRNTLLAGRCDLYVGLPAHDFMSRQLALSRPFATLHYAVVTAASTQPRPSPGAPQELAGRRVAVQLATPPHAMLAALDGVEAITVRSADEGMQALADDRADVAYLWGPSAGYLNRSVYGDRFQVQPIAGPDMAWPVAVAFRRGDDALRDDVQRELDQLGPWVAQAEARYGFAQQAEAGAAAAAAAPIVVAQATPAGADKASIERGRTLYNNNCSHCHGPDAASPDAKIDLRRLTRRYHEDKDTVFNDTVHKGRPDKGMPTWGGVLPDADIALIKAFVDSVQVK